MSSLGRAIAVLGAVSVIGTATQVAKGKLGALFLGASGLGVLNQLTLLYSLLFVVAGLGFFNGMMRQITLAVKDGDKRLARAQMNSVTLFLGFVSLGISVVCIFQSEWISDVLFGDAGDRASLVCLVILAVPIAVQQRIFRAYLNSTRDINAISRAQVGADVASVGIYAIGAWYFGIWGAAIAFVAMHALLLISMLTFSVRSGGIGLALPNFRRFRWQEILPNFGYGINGLIMTAAATASAIIIGRMIISVYDIEHLGIFSVSWKVATVYLGALYAAAGSYYFPTLLRLEETIDIEREANHAVGLYMTILPPLMAGLIVFGDELIRVIFSSEFLPATLVMTGLLLGDIFRVTAETMGLNLLARRHLVAYTGIYLFYAAGFLGLSWLLLPTYGLPSVALAYIVMQIFNLLLVLVTCRFSLGIGLNRKGIRSFLFAIIAIAPLALSELLEFSTRTKLGIAILIGIGWLSASWNTDETVEIRSKFLQRLKNSG